MTTFLNEFRIPKAPLQYGTETCCLVLADSRFSTKMVQLRGDPAVGAFLNKVDISIEEHERWMASRHKTQNVLDFVVLIAGEFGGNISLSDIAFAQHCELGRFIMPADGRRVFSLAVEFLTMSFAFEILQVKDLYCAVIQENMSTLRLHLENGWRLYPSFDRDHRVNGRQMHLVGMHIASSEWRIAFDNMQKRVQRLLCTNQ